MTTLHAEALKHLHATDRKLSGVIKVVGPCTLKRSGGTFELLARSILSQQISVAAARTIRRRLEDALPNKRLSAVGILQLGETSLGAVGVSRQKRGYLLDLCEKVQSGELNLRRIAQIDDELVIEELIKVKGIGRWTAQMFLMFGIGRPDIFAPDDLGLQNSMKVVYGLPAPVKPVHVEPISQAWAPFRSIASWYLWQYLDVMKKG